MKKGPENKNLKETIVFLEKTSKKNNSGIWKKVAEKISKPRRLHAQVNLGKISRLTKPNDKIVVVGKVLGAGSLSHAVEIASIAASEGTRGKVKKAGGKLVSIREMAEANPKGSGIVILQ